MNTWRFHKIVPLTFNTYSSVLFHWSKHFWDYSFEIMLSFAHCISFNVFHIFKSLTLMHMEGTAPSTILYFTELNPISIKRFCTCTILCFTELSLMSIEVCTCTILCFTGQSLMSIERVCTCTILCFTELSLMSIERFALAQSCVSQS